MLNVILAAVLLTGLLLATPSSPAATVSQCAHVPSAKGCATLLRSGDPTCEEGDLGSSRVEAGLDAGPARAGVVRATACDNRTGDAWRQSILEAHAGLAGTGLDAEWSGTEDDGEERSRVSAAAETEDQGAELLWRQAADKRSYERTCKVGASAHEDIMEISHEEYWPCWALGPPSPPGALPLLLP